jgi:hypothetical protein
MTNLQPIAAASLATWHRMIRERDLSGLRSIVHPAAVFRSPMAFTPYASADAVVLLLTTVSGVLEDFTYHRELSDGDNAMLEFSARVGDRMLKGIDLIRFDAAGLIIDFEVMIRPASGLQALGAEMAARVGAQLTAFKA